MKLCGKETLGLTFEILHRTTQKQEFTSRVGQIADQLVVLATDVLPATKIFTRENDVGSPDPKFPPNAWWRKMMPDVGLLVT